MIRQLGLRERRGGGVTGLAVCGLSGSSMCHGKENMPPVAGLFKVTLQRFNANITDRSGPKAGRKQEVFANPGLP